MPFSRYQIRNEFSLADPELYKAADKDDPEALLEGVAMAGLVGVLRQLGDLAEFAAEIFHGLHEEVMVTAARGHSLLVRVQQVESDFPAIERAFLSQTGHSAFFSSSGISWHPNLQMEHNLITKGDLPRFVMDSYEECRGPPRLFLLDKFDVGGAGACLKRYTDPSFYKVEASSYEMMSVEAQREKKIRKTKKKGQRWKNGETPDVFQPSHVKLHQLLLEERVQNGATEPARRVKLKKREIKYPFDTEKGKGYMEKLLNSPSEDELVHDVPVGSSFLRLPTNSSEEVEPETPEVRMVNSPLDMPETLEAIMANSPLDVIEETHISVDEEHRENGIEDDYQSDDVASETENYMDALATMESEVETDAEIKAARSDPIIKQESFSDSNVEKLQSRFSDSPSASDDESSSIKNKVSTYSCSDTTTSSSDNMSPRGVNSPQPFATTEIPFRPRAPQNQVFDNCIEASNNSAYQESSSNEQTSDLNETLSNNCVDIGGSTREDEIEIAPEEIESSTCLGIPQNEVDNEDNISNSSLVISNEEVQPLYPSLDKHDICEVDDFLESTSDAAEAKVSYSTEYETSFKDEETKSIDSESKDANAVVFKAADDKNGDKLSNHEDEKELEGEPESVNSETEDLIPASNEIMGLSTFEETELEGREVGSVESEKNEDEGVCTTEESCKNELGLNESGIVLKSDTSFDNESDEQSVISAENETIGSDVKKVLSEESAISSDYEKIKSGEENELGEESVISPSADSVPSAYYDHLNIQDRGSTPTSSPATFNDVNENDVDASSSNSKILQDKALFVIEKTDQNVPQEDRNAQFLDNAPDSSVSAGAEESKSSNLFDHNEESKSQNQDHQSDKLEAMSSSFNQSVSVEEKTDELEALDSQIQDNQADELEASSSILNQSVSIEEKTDQLESQDFQNQDNQTDKLEAISSISKHSVEEKADEFETLDSLNQDNQTDKLETISSIKKNSVSVEDEADELETLDSQSHVDCHSESYLVNHDHFDKPETISSIKEHSVSLEDEADEFQPLDSQNHVDSHSESYLVNHDDHSEIQDHVELSVFLEDEADDFESLDSQNNVDCHSESYLMNHDHSYKLETISSIKEHSVSLEDKADEFQTLDSQNHVGSHSESYLVNHDDHSEIQDHVEPSVALADLSQFSSNFNLSGFNMLPELAPINLEEMPPLPPLPPMQWRLGKLQHSSLISRPDDVQHDIHHFPPAFPQVDHHPSIDQNGNATKGKSERDHDGNAKNIAVENVPKLPLNNMESQNATTSGTEIIRPSSTSTLPPADDERPNGIRPMKIQRPRTPLIDAVAAHDINKLRKVSEQAMPLFPKGEERDTFLDQIRAQSFNLKPAVQTRPIIQGPSTNLRVAAILEKANAIRQAFAGSDDDEDDNDSWSDS